MMKKILIRLKEMKNLFLGIVRLLCGAACLTFGHIWLTQSSTRTTTAGSLLVVYVGVFFIFRMGHWHGYFKSKQIHFGQSMPIEYLRQDEIVRLKGVTTFSKHTMLTLQLAGRGKMVLVYTLEKKDKNSAEYVANHYYHFDGSVLTPLPMSND
jgi:hypothetical protein